MRGNDTVRKIIEAVSVNESGKDALSYDTLVCRQNLSWKSTKDSDFKPLSYYRDTYGEVKYKGKYYIFMEDFYEVNDVPNVTVSKDEKKYLGDYYFSVMCVRLGDKIDKKVFPGVPCYSVYYSADKYSEPEDFTYRELDRVDYVEEEIPGFEVRI